VMAVLNRLIAAIALCTTVFLASVPGSTNASSVGAHPNHRSRMHRRSRDRALGVAERDYEQGLVPRGAHIQRHCKAKSNSSETGHSTTPYNLPVISTSNPATTTSTWAATTTTTSTTSNTASPTTVSPGKKKVGLAWAGNDPKLLKKFVTDKTGYVYTWSPNCPDGYESTGLECARMLWGPNQVDTFRKLRQTPGTSILMGMNEVNIPGQSNMDVQSGIQLWNNEIRWLGQKGMTLVSPSVTCQDSGLQWLKGFFAGCGGNDNCGVNILSIHIYTTSTDNFISLVEQYHQAFGLPIWVSEWACQDFSGKDQQCSSDQIWSFVKTMTAWFDQTDYVYGQFPFGFLSSMNNVNQLDQLIGSDGLPNSLGTFILNS